MSGSKLKCVFDMVDMMLVGEGLETVLSTIL